MSNSVVSIPKMSKSSGEFLLDNYVTNEIQNIFYPFYLVQNMVLSSKTRIKNNFIYPNGNKFNITVAVILTISFVLYVNIVAFGSILKITDTNTSKLHLFLKYFFSIYNYVGVFIVFIFNVIHGHSNVLLILTIQTIHLNINIGEKATKYLIIWNWICCLSTFFIGIMLIVYFSTAFGYIKMTDIGVEYLLISVDLNLIYAIRIIILLKTYLNKFIVNNLLTDNLQHNFENDIAIYQNCMKVYELFKKIFQSSVISKRFYLSCNGFMFSQESCNSILKQTSSID